MQRREFLKLVSYMTVALKTGILTSGQALAGPSGAGITSNGLKGSIVAACMNPKREGEFSRQTHDTVLSRMDLETGDVDLVPLDLVNAHDALKVKDHYFVLPNAKSAELVISDFSGHSEKLNLGKDGDGRFITGHGFHDEKENTVIVSITNKKNGAKGEFAILDADNYQLIDVIESSGFSPHDIQLFDENTLAVCDYNQVKGKYSDGWGGAELLNDQSALSLYDRKTLKLKEKIPAYKNAMISHATVTKGGDLFAIGFNEFYDPGVETWPAEYIEGKFSEFFKDNQPELLPQWPDIAKNLTIARIEKSIQGFGIPLLPLKLSSSAHDLEVLNVPHFHHRRAQSICYVEQTNTVCMSFPFSNTLLLYNATTGVSRHVSGKDLNLEEVRGISEVEGTSYLAVAGIRRGITIIDTAAENNIKHYDVEMGRIIHMHHVA